MGGPIGLQCGIWAVLFFSLYLIIRGSNISIIRHREKNLGKASYSGDDLIVTGPKGPLPMNEGSANIVSQHLFWFLGSPPEKFSYINSITPADGK